MSLAKLLLHLIVAFFDDVLKKSFRYALTCYTVYGQHIYPSRPAQWHLTGLLTLILISSACSTSTNDEQLSKRSVSTNTFDCDVMCLLTMT